MKEGRQIMTRIVLVLATVVVLPGQLAAGGWTLPKGRLWLKSALYHQSTASRFCTRQDALSLAFRNAGCTAAGHRAPFDPFIGGEIEALVIFNELAYGASNRLEVGVQVPFYRLRFTNLANPQRSASQGVGDVRFYAKYRFVDGPIVASVRVGAKSPTGEFSTDAEIVNISEGQWDFELIGEVSRSFWPVPIYASVGAGYRVRLEKDAFEQTFENEWLAVAELGVQLSDRLLAKGTLDWLRGGRPRIKATGTRLLWRRELMTLAPSLSLAIWRELKFEGGVRFAIRGRDYPAGTEWLTALSYDFPLIM